MKRSVGTANALSRSQRFNSIENAKQSRNRSSGTYTGTNHNRYGRIPKRKILAQSFNSKCSNQIDISAISAFGMSKFDTYTTDAVRPSTSFMGLSRKEAIARLSQVPKNLFNPLTDQMTSIVGHNENVLLKKYQDQLTEMRARKEGQRDVNKNKKNCFATQLHALQDITI